MSEKTVKKTKFEEKFCEPVPFHEFDGGCFMGYAISANRYTQEEARVIFEQLQGGYINIDCITKDYVRFGLQNTDCGAVSGWMECKNKKGSQPIWYISDEEIKELIK